MTNSPAAVEEETPPESCFHCGTELELAPEGLDEHYCLNCQDHFPTAILEAVFRKGAYVLGLKDGSVIRFTEAVPGDPWVRLTGVTQGPERFGALNAMDVRLSEIVWASDYDED